MRSLLAISRAIDAVNTKLGKLVAWLLVVAVAVSTTNAIVRKLLHTSSNAWLELQWYLFSAAFLFCAAWTVIANEHIRIDIVNSLFSKRVRNWIDMIGHVFALLPFCIVMIWTSVPFFLTSYRLGERSFSAGGLPQWPAKLLIPVAFTILLVQAISEIIKRAAIMRGVIPDPHDGPQVHAAEAEAERLLQVAKKPVLIQNSPEHSAMTAFIIHNMAPIMFASLVVFLLIGYPVAFTLAAVGLVYAIIGIELGLFAPNFLQAMPERVYGTMNNDTLLAIPFFTFMGLILERSGMAEDLLDTIGQVFGPIRGGLAYAVIFVGALLAATTGVVAASVISMGLISLPIMLRYGYDRRLASGVIAASGTLAQIIPPSLVLIVMADQLGRSVGDMYEGAFVPGLILSSLYAGYVMLIAFLFPNRAPGLPPEAQTLKEDGDRRPLRTLTNLIGVIAAVPFVIFLLVASALFAVFALVGGIVGSGSSLGLPAPVKEYGIEILAGLAALYALFIGVRSRDFVSRPHANLALLVVVSGLIGYLIMSGTTYKGADFVVLAMFVGIVFAFLVSVGDRYRGLAGVIGAIVAMTATAYVYMYHPLPVATGVIAFLEPLLRVGAALAVGAVAFFAISLIVGSIPLLREPLLSEMSRQVTAVMVPPLALIFLVLGTIFIGLATPTEGGAMGAAGAVLLAIFKGRLNFSLVKQATESTAKLSAFVLFILLGARVFSLTFYGVDGHKWVEELLVSLPGGQIGFLLFINALVFLLAFFLDFFELAFIIVPLLGPAAERVGIDLIWFGVILAVNMQTSFMHPPFGFALFYLRSVAPKESYVDKVSGQVTAGVTTGQIYWGAVPFVVIQCIMVVLVIMFPQMVMHYKGVGTGIDPNKVKIEIQMPDEPLGPPKF